MSTVLNRWSANHWWFVETSLMKNLILTCILEKKIKIYAWQKMLVVHELKTLRTVERLDHSI